MISVTECEFDGVPKKHHINCGLSIASHNITLNLLAEVHRVCVCVCVCVWCVSVSLLKGAGLMCLLSVVAVSLSKKPNIIILHYSEKEQPIKFLNQWVPGNIWGNKCQTTVQWKRLGAHIIITLVHGTHLFHSVGVKDLDGC